MASIKRLVKEALTTGYLTVRDENTLRSLLKTKYPSEDLTAFMELQQAAMNGWVKQESRELFNRQQKSTCCVN
jgi:hypothetical protein